MFSATLCKSDQKVCRSDIRCCNILVEVQFSVKVLLWLFLKKLNVIIRLAQYREDEMRYEVVRVWLEQSPHGLWLDAFVEEVESVVQAGLGQPHLLAHPFLYLLEVDFEDLGRKVGNEVLGNLCVVDLVVLAQGGWVAVPE